MLRIYLETEKKIKKYFTFTLKSAIISWHAPEAVSSESPTDRSVSGMNKKGGNHNDFERKES